MAAASTHNQRGRRDNGGAANGYAPTTPAAVSTFKCANESVRTLGTRLERKDKDQFLNLQKSLEQHIITEFKNPADIIVAIQDITNPMKPIMKDMPKVIDLMDDMGLTDAEKADKTIVTSINKLHAEEMKVFAARRAILCQNKTKAYGIFGDNAALHSSSN
jgi:hypothetical protein